MVTTLVITVSAHLLIDSGPRVSLGIPQLPLVGSEEKQGRGDQ